MANTNDDNGLMLLMNAELEYDAESLIYGYESDNLVEVVQHVNKNGDTPLILACKNKMKTITELLCVELFGDLKLDNINSNNETALLWACYNNFPHVIEFLVKYDMSNISHANNDGNTSLILTCGKCMRESAILLLQTGQANPGHINKNGGTALLWASYKNLPDVVSELLKHDCNVKHKREDKSALKIAFNKRHDEIVLMLIKHDWSVLENEKDNFIFDVLDCYYNSLSSLTGCITSNKLVELLNDTMLERFLDIDTLVDFK